jgi:hypothetical protein
MDEMELAAHSFIIRIWVEERSEATGRGIWRGSITQVSSGQRRYLSNLEEIADFIIPCLQDMGMNIGVRWRMRRWLRRLTGVRSGLFRCPSETLSDTKRKIDA